MSFDRIWVHLVFSTKNRQPLLTRKIRAKVCSHIVVNCKDKKIYLSAVNGYAEHIHCLISLGKEQTISKTTMLIKGESAFWINKHNLTKEKFVWQDDYFAVSVGETQIDYVRQYIANQETHHATKTFAEEVDELMTKYR